MRRRILVNNVNIDLSDTTQARADDEVDGILRRALKRAYFNGSTDVKARENGVIPNDTKLGEVQIEVILNDAKAELEDHFAAKQDLAGNRMLTVYELTSKIRMAGFELKRRGLLFPQHELDAQIARLSPTEEEKR